MPKRPGPSDSCEPVRALPRARLALAVAALLIVPWTLAVLSLVRESPTIDEVVHLPAGVSYWQKQTFKFYPHNPPLVKLLAAAPVVAADPATERMYAWPPGKPYWRDREPNKAGLAHVFQEDNAARYFELFARARLLMPTFGLIGGLVVFFWSRRLYGDLGGLLSLTVWSSCPNVLAHARLITTDVAATSLGCLATFAFWTYLHRPTWTRAMFAGLALGLAQLTKFSMLILFGLWPLLALVFLGRGGGPRVLGRTVLQGALIAALAVLAINAGYGFEEVGKPLGSFQFMSSPLAVWRSRPADPTLNPDLRITPLYSLIRNARVNRFEGGPLANLPVPLPAFYLGGFDEQKLEADGVWARFLDARLAELPLDDPRGRALAGYPVYLDGQLAQESWSSYYLYCLLYKVPEGTWFLGLSSLVLLLTAKRDRAAWADEFAVHLVPAATLAAISLGTNINIGLRYILPIFPYVFVGMGKLAPWCAGLTGVKQWLATGAMGLSLTATVAACLSVHPHYLAYFNWASGGTKRGAEHLIDSNLDWGQDLLGLYAWLRRNAPNEPVGLAYFGQIHPDVFAARGEPIDWYLPPARPGTIFPPSPSQLPGRLGERLRPGLYAISASLVRGLDWRVYDRAYTPTEQARGFAPVRAERMAFSYFQGVRPFHVIGGSIHLYRLDEEDVAKLQARMAR